MAYVQVQNNDKKKFFLFNIRWSIKEKQVNFVWKEETIC